MTKTNIGHIQNEYNKYLIENHGIEPNVVICNIIWKDEERNQEYNQPDDLYFETIALTEELKTHWDDDMFFYIDNIEDLNYLMNKDNDEDFYISDNIKFGIYPIYDENYNVVNMPMDCTNKDFEAKARMASIDCYFEIIDILKYLKNKHNIDCLTFKLNNRFYWHLVDKKTDVAEPIKISGISLATDKSNNIIYHAHNIDYNGKDLIDEYPMLPFQIYSSVLAECKERNL